MAIHVGQTSLRILAYTKVDISGALDLAILYEKPSGTTGQWTALSLDNTRGIIYYDVTFSTDLDEAGQWRMRSYVRFEDGREAKGRIVQVTIEEDEF